MPRHWPPVILLLLLTLAAATPARAGSSLDRYSNGGRILLPLAAAGATVAVQDKAGFTQWGLATANTLALTEALKIAIDAERPNGQGGRAFPSGHAAAAFSGAAFLHERYGWQIGLPAEALAAGVAYARVHEGDHRWRDVIAGAAIAHLSAFVYVDPLNESVSLLPLIDARKGSFGVAVRLGF